jgi:hypothetical protein
VSLAHPVVVVSPAVAGWAVLRVVTVFQVLAMRWFSLGLPGSPEYRGLLRFQRSHVDGKAIFNVRPNHALVGFVDLLDRNDFHVGGDVALTAEVEHLLRFGDATNR